VNEHEVSPAIFGLVRADIGDAANGFDTQRRGRYEADIPSARVKQRVPPSDSCGEHFQDELAGARLAGVRKIQDLERAVGCSNTESNHDFSVCIDCVSQCFWFQVDKASRFASVALQGVPRSGPGHAVVV
jgi:hypothetical protein